VIEPWQLLLGIALGFWFGWDLRYVYERRNRWHSPFSAQVWGVCRKCRHNGNTPIYDESRRLLMFKCPCGYHWDEPTEDKEDGKVEEWRTSRGRRMTQDI
jgi:hypothetical protein